MQNVCINSLLLTRQTQLRKISPSPTAQKTDKIVSNNSKFFSILIHQEKTTVFCVVYDTGMDGNFIDFLLPLAPFVLKTNVSFAYNNHKRKLFLFYFFVGKKRFRSFFRSTCQKMSSYLFSKVQKCIPIWIPRRKIKIMTFTIVFISMN